MADRIQHPVIFELLISMVEFSQGVIRGKVRARDHAVASLRIHFFLKILTDLVRVERQLENRVAAELVQVHPSEQQHFVVRADEVDSPPGAGNTFPENCDRCPGVCVEI